MTAGHLGEWLAAAIVDVDLEPSATAAGADGRFRSGRLAGLSVNIKWYLKQEGLLDIADPGPDVYLVLAGPRSGAGPSRDQVRPWCIESVHLFDAPALVAAQRERGVKLGAASSVLVAFWTHAEIYRE